MLLHYVEKSFPRTILQDNVDVLSILIEVHAGDDIDVTEVH